MNGSSMSDMVRWVLFSAAIILTGCADQDLTSGPAVPADGAAQVRVHVPLAATTVTKVSVDVTADDMEPLAFELTIEEGAASGTLTLPAGFDRTITLRAFDGGDIETHRGSMTLDIEPGSAPDVAITLDPLSGEQPIEATLGEVVLVSVSPDSLIFFKNDTVQLTANLVDSNGDAVDLPVRWAVVQPSLVEISPSGEAWLTDPTAESQTATIVAALGTQVRTTEVTFMSAEGVVGLVDQELERAFWQWWQITADLYAGAPALSAMSFQHSTSAANFAMEYYSAIPRASVQNDPIHSDYTVTRRPFEWAYEAIAGVNTAYALMDHFTSRGMFDPTTEARVRGVGSYLQGVSYGSLALRFDGGPLLGTHTDLESASEFTDYTGLLTKSLELLDQAITTASATTFDVPAPVLQTGEPVSSAVLARAAHSYKARLRAGVARTPAERAAVDWNAVLLDISRGVRVDFGYIMNYPEIWHGSLYYTILGSGWSQLNYFVHGMADQSGAYQEWMDQPLETRHPNLPSGRAFLIVTPDQRFPQGATRQEQLERPGSRFMAPASVNWSNPERGTWRWSYYRTAMDPLMADRGFLPDLSVTEMNLLAAEAHYRLGDLAAAAELVNITRTAAGLNAADPGAAVSNTSCVPKLPDGSCGDLFEMIKWEKRLEASHTNAAYMMATWYYEGRGWGDLLEGTPLQWPIPARVAEQFELPVRSYGGGLDYSAPVGTYGY